MRRVKPAKSLESAKFLLMRRRMQKYLPRRPGRLLAWLTVLVLGGFGLLGAVDLFDHGSRLEGAIVTTTATFGLTVQDVAVEGRAMTPPADLLAALDTKRGAPLLGVAPDAARARIEKLPWVEAASVERRWPDRLFIRLTERRPLALWQHQGRLMLIGTDGTVITSEHLERFPGLLQVVGEGADKAAAALIAMLDGEPDLEKRVTAAVRVGERRWNLAFEGGITVELPEENAAEAWAHLAEIERDHALLARDVVMVDLRLADRVVVTPAAEPAKAPASHAKPAAKPT